WGNHSSRSRVTAALEQPTRKKRGTHACAPPLRVCADFPIWPCSRWGLPCRRVLPPTRCALTAPFHPYQRLAALRRFAFCCTIRGPAPPRRYLAPCPLEPGLSSPNHRFAAIAWPAPGATLAAAARVRLPAQRSAAD